VELVAEQKSAENEMYEKKFMTLIESRHKKVDFA
jgi:hypothetical protein